MASDETVEKTLTKVTTSLWGAYGTNGLNADVKRHSKDIGELYARDELLRSDIDKRFSEFSDRLGGLYRLLATMAITLAVGLLGIVGTLVATA